jgi:hypothetical protein
MALIEVKFTPTDAMPVYQGTCSILDEEGRKIKPLVIIKKSGTYKLPYPKVKQLCHDFPENFSSPEKFDFSEFDLVGGTIYLEPGQGVPDHNRKAKAPEFTK